MSIGVCECTTHVLHGGNGCSGAAVVCGLCRASHVAERGVRVMHARPSCRVAEVYCVMSGYDHIRML
jgi:hypothetical protein